MERTKFINEVNLTLRVSNDTDKRSAINKISDKLTSIRTYMATGKDLNGQYNPILNFDVQVFSATSKAPTKVAANIAPGEYINVRGNLSSKKFKTNDGRELISFIINATEITTPDEMEQENETSTVVPEEFTPVSEEDNPWG